MTDKRTQAEADHGNMEKDPSDWVTGDEPMTGAQTSYLKTLSEEAHVDFDAGLSKAAASRRIDELQQMTGRGLEHKHRGAAGSAPPDRSRAGESSDGGDGGESGEGGDEVRLSVGPG